MPPTGANRGIGLELIRTFSANGWRTIGSVRPQTMLENDPSVSEVTTPGTNPLEPGGHENKLAHKDW
jgi:NAD(P)-dependent dehydrogenase (short-subunit alcohol dehydrogenase family)